MRNKLFRIIKFLLSIIILLCNINICMADNKAENDTVKEAKNLFDGIVSYKLKENGVTNIQQWIDKSITKDAGVTSEWYVIALSQSGEYNFSAYEKALINYLSSNEVASATSREKYALSLISVGSTDKYISKTLNDSIGRQGIMSYIFGLHMLNNGYKSWEYTINDIKNKLLQSQLSDGGFALMGKTGDVDVTAMTLQSLAPYYKTDSSVKAAIDKALTFLSKMQQSSGAYKSYGVENPESTAQVLLALVSLGIDIEKDTRFIKNENTLIDGIEKFKLSSGAFCHKEGGEANESATTQVFYTMAAYLRAEKNQSSLYIFDKRRPEEVQTISINIDKETTSTIKVDVNTTKKIDTQSEKVTTKQNNAALETTKKLGGTVTIIKTDNGNQNQNLTQKDNGLGGNEPETTSNLENGTEINKAEVGDNTEGTSDGNVIVTEVEVGANADEETKNSISNVEGEKVTLNTNSTQKESNGYKPLASIGVLVAGVIIAVITYLKKGKNKKNLILIGIIVVAILSFIWLTDFKSVNDYYEAATKQKENPVGAITISVKCTTIVGKDNNENVPSDGIILKETKWDIEEGDTVYDVLVSTLAAEHIHMESKGNGGITYIEGINHIYELDYGDLSGWMYMVNGEMPSVSCGEYKLRSGDVVEWVYTCNMGEDVR